MTTEFGGNNEAMEWWVFVGSVGWGGEEVDEKVLDTAAFFGLVFRVEYERWIFDNSRRLQAI